ncbi:MAG: sigma-70 family RNA polymerase sigma factor [Chloroflexota bacterium]
MPKTTPGSPPDEELLRQIASGDSSALETLYERHSVPVYNYLLRLVGEVPAAEDLLQEVFIAVWRGAGSYRQLSSVKTWVLSIAHHRAVSWLRRRRKFSLFEDVHILDSRPGPELQAFSGWEVEQLQQALEGLSVNHRAVIELTFVHGLSYREIAQVMGCPEGTVKSRMSYALRQLTGLLKGKGV